MKKWVVVSLVAMLLLALLGCTVNKQLKGDDISSISVLLDKVKQCKPEPEGMKIYTIPPKNMVPKDGKSLLFLSVYIYQDVYGFVLYSDNGYILVEKQADKWVFDQNGAGQYINDEQAAKLWEQWVGFLPQYDLDRGQCGVIKAVSEAPKTVI